MSNIVQDAMRLMEVLPESEQERVFEFIKSVVLEWDTDFTKVSAAEAKQISEAEQSGFIDEENINWNKVGIE